MESVIIGVVSSLIATFIFLSSNHWFKTQFMPWYSDKIYRGVRVEGKWKLNTLQSEEDSPDNEAFMQLIQYGEKIEGTYAHKYMNDGNIVRGTYILKGEIRDRYFIALLRPSTNDVTDAAALVLQAYSPHNSLVLKGGIVCINPEDINVTTSSNIEFVRT
jgi:hypothetical protein